MRQQRFTLVEILVVVGIIAVLAGLLMPALNRARISARTAECLSNQRQVSQFIKQSMNDNDQHFMSYNTTVKLNVTKAEKMQWGAYLKDKNYIQDVAVMRCPSFEYTKNDGIADQLSQIYGAAFFTPPSGTTQTETQGFDFRGTKLLTYNNNTLIAPNALALGGCCGTGGTGGTDLLASPLMQFDAASTETTIGNPVKIHGDFVNLFFLDGHCESLNKEGTEGRYYPANDKADKIAAQAWLDPDEK